MKKLLLFSALVCIILAACGGQNNVPTAFPSVTPQASLEATSFPTRTLPTQPPATPTMTPFPPYPNKQVVFDYYVTGNQADWDIFFDPPSGNIVTKLVLYDDGQMLIAGTGEAYKQKVLSSAEMKSFLSKLETLGFYSIESNQQHDPTDDLYDFGGRYDEIEVMDGLKICILVEADQSRNLCVHESYMQFFVPKMKNILKHLDEYNPAGTIPYDPDRIFLAIQADDDPSVDHPPAVPWKEDFPSLESESGSYTSDPSSQVRYIDGDMAKEIVLFLEDADGWKVVSQNGREYFVRIRVLLPHEKVRNPYQ